MIRHSPRLYWELARALVKELGIDESRVSLTDVVNWKDEHTQYVIGEALQDLLDRLELRDLDEHLALAES